MTRLQVAVAFVVLATGAGVVGIPASASVGAEPTVSRTVGELAYVASTGRRATDVFVSDTDGSHRRRVTYSGRAQLPAWSADGARIAYLNNGELAVMAADGSDSEVVADGNVAWDKPAWSPDGTRVAFTSWDDDGTYLATVDLATEEITRLTTATEDWPGAWSPSWSPDGAQIAFVRNSDVAQDDYSTYSPLFVMDADGTDLRQVSVLETEVRSVDWSPDGGRLLYATTYSGRDGPTCASDIYSVRPDGTDVTVESDSGCVETSPSWSPDGSRFALESSGPNEYDHGPVTWYPRTSGVWVLDRASGDISLVARFASSPDWRPVADHTVTAAAGSYDAARPLTFGAVTGAGYDLFSLAATPGRDTPAEVRRLTRDGHATGPTLGRNPGRIFFLHRGPDVPGYWSTAIWRMNRSGGARRVVLASTHGWGQVAVSPSGRRVALVRGSRLMVLTVATGTVRELVRLPGEWADLAEPAWSRDGRRIAFVAPTPGSGHGEIFVVGSDGSGLRRVTHSPGDESSPSWSPTADRLAFTYAVRGNPDVWVSRADGGRRHRLYRSPGEDTNPVWSPDGRRIAFISDSYRPYGRRPMAGIWTIRPNGSDPTFAHPSRQVVDLAW